MSRIGKQPIPVPTGVTVSIETDRVRVNGPKGELSERIPRDIVVELEGGTAGEAGGQDDARRRQARLECERIYVSDH